MKFRPLIIIVCLFFSYEYTSAQERPANGGLEGWRRGQFRCCGRNVENPFNWGIPEQSCGLNYNKFVFLEDNPFNVHSGRYSALLYSDTTFLNGVGLQPGMLVYGGYQDPLDSAIRIGQAVPQYGLPIDSNPEKLDFWLLMSHDLADTFSYMYLFTRWDSTLHQEDTIAFAQKDIPDTQAPIDQWFRIRDSICYRHSGKADTVKMIFYGGRFGNPALAGNSTWIDDIKFIYIQDSVSATTGIKGSSDVNCRIYPNPASNILQIQSPVDATCCFVTLTDHLGRCVYHSMLLSPLWATDISDLSSGSYICSITNADNNLLCQKRIVIIH